MNKGFKLSPNAFAELKAIAYEEIDPSLSDDEIEEMGCRLLRLSQAGRNQWGYREKSKSVFGKPPLTALAGCWMKLIQRYPTDLTDAEWEWIEPHVPKPKAGGRPAKHPRRRILNAIFYIVRGGCAWRLLPRDFAPWATVYDYFRQWVRSGLWAQLNHLLRELLRVQSRRAPTPSAAMLDSQSVKPGNQAGVRGVDAGKKINGRKRHLLVDTLGLVLWALVTPASVQDRDGAKSVLQRVLGVLRRWQVIWADGAYLGGLVAWVKGQRPFGKLQLQIVPKPAGQKGFQILPKRWIVERTFGWLTKSRRLVRDYETRTDHSEAFIYIAMLRIMLRRLAKP